MSGINPMIDLVGRAQQKNDLIQCEREMREDFQRR